MPNDLQSRLTDGFYLLMDADSTGARVRVVWGDGEHAAYLNGARLEAQAVTIAQALADVEALLQAPGQISSHLAT